MAPGAPREGPRYATVGMDEDGNVRVCCENCGSTNLNFDGWDIDKCRDCGHLRYRASDEKQSGGTR